MANGKSDHKLVKTLAIIILVVIASFFRIDVTDVIPEETINSTTDGATTVEGELIVHMIDCGQADSFLLVQGEKTCLVDCGTRGTGKDVVKYLKELGVTKLDYIIGTHPHDDHMGGMYDVLCNFETGTIILPKVKSGQVTTNWYLKLMNKIKSDKCQVEFAEVGDVYNIEDAKMQIIAAQRDCNNLNNYSIVTKVSFGEIDMIMTGDAETEVEEEILKSRVNIDAEILKVGHHGSDTSSSEEFLDAINPDYSLISCEVGNQHEHPIKSTMDKLKERNIEVYRTDESGSVVITITSNDINFNCKPGDYLSGIELEEKVTK